MSPLRLYIKGYKLYLTTLLLMFFFQCIKEMSEMPADEIVESQTSSMTESSGNIVSD
jgi:hypothetical protein